MNTYARAGARWLGLAGVLAISASCSSSRDGAAEATLSERSADYGFARIRRDVFEPRCQGCHETSHVTSVDLTTHAGVQRDIFKIYRRVFYTETMPPPPNTLESRERDLLWAWISAGSPEVTETEPTIPARGPVRSFVLANFLFPSKTGLTVGDLARATREKNLRTVEALLGELPDEMLRNYVLAFDSRSLQAASMRAPRVITYTNDGRLLLAFNGDPAHMGYESVEAIEFVRDANGKARFDFSEIRFDESGAAPATLERNPERCKACHTRALRPNWDGYFVWPGFYGGEDDFLTRSPPSYAASAEGNGHDAFLALRAEEQARGKGRYRFLRDLTELPTTALIVPVSNAAQQPNTRLNLLLHDLNFIRMADELRESPKIEKGKLALDALGCDNFFDFFSPAWRESHQPRWAEISASVAAAVKDERRARLDRHRRLVGSSINPRLAGFGEPSTGDSVLPARLRFLVEEYLGMDASDGSMTFGGVPNEDVFGSADAGLGLFTRVAVEPELFTSPADQAFIRSTWQGPSANRCAALLQESLKRHGPLD